MALPNGTEVGINQPDEAEVALGDARGALVGCTLVKEFPFGALQGTVVFAHRPDGNELLFRVVREAVPQQPLSLKRVDAHFLSTLAGTVFAWCFTTSLQVLSINMILMRIVWIGRWGIL